MVKELPIRARFSMNFRRVLSIPSPVDGFRLFFGQGEFDVFASMKVESVWLRCWSFLLVSVGHPSDERM